MVGGVLEIRDQYQQEIMKDKEVLTYRNKYKKESKPNGESRNRRTIYRIFSGIDSPSLSVDDDENTRTLRDVVDGIRKHCLKRRSSYTRSFRGVTLTSK